MRTIIGLIVVLAVTACAPSFVDTLADKGIGVVSEQDAVRLAEAVCRARKANVPGEVIARLLADDTPHLSADQVVVFVEEATRYYCPRNA